MPILMSPAPVAKTDLHRNLVQLEWSIFMEHGRRDPQNIRVLLPVLHRYKFITDKIFIDGASPLGMMRICSLREVVLTNEKSQAAYVVPHRSVDDQKKFPAVTVAQLVNVEGLQSVRHEQHSIAVGGDRQLDSSSTFCHQEGYLGGASSSTTLPRVAGSILWAISSMIWFTSKV